MQRLLGEAVCDADKVRDDVRRYVVDELGDPAVVLIIDDTGDLTAGRRTIASRHGYTLIDRGHPLVCGDLLPHQQECRWAG